MGCAIFVQWFQLWFWCDTWLTALISVQHSFSRNNLSWWTRFPNVNPHTPHQFRTNLPWKYRKIHGFMGWKSLQIWEILRFMKEYWDMKWAVIRRYLISYNLVLLQFAEETHPCLYQLTISHFHFNLKEKPEIFVLKLSDIFYICKW